MTDSTGTGNAPEAQGATLLQKPGELIRAKREAAGMTQAQVGEALHLTVHYIKSLENDEYSKLPGLTFVKGYMRSYARLLKLDEAAIIESYDQYVASLGLQESPQEQSIRVRRRNDQAILWAVVAGVILVIGLGAGWWFFGREDGAAASTVSVVRTPAPVTTTLAPPAQTQTVATPAAVAPAFAAAVTETRPDPFAAQAIAEEDAGAEFPAGAGAGTLAAESLAGAEAAESLPNTTTLMTEDGPLVLADAEADPVTTAAAGTANDVRVSTALIESAEPAAAGSTDSGEQIAQTAAAPTGTNTRRVELVGNGADQLELQFAGNSWVEVDDGARVRLYSDMMRDGDALSIKAAAPFHILLGDATGVSVLLNGQPLPIATNIRSDKTARVMISAEGVSAWAVE